jgi:hypothetical protein
VIGRIKALGSVRFVQEFSGQIDSSFCWKVSLGVQ